MMELYTYFRSSSAYRVRIALNLKQLDYKAIFIHLTRGGGEQKAPSFSSLNPACLVPVFKEGVETMTQSLAILEYLEEQHPFPALLPSDAVDRAWVRSLSLQIACEIHPLNNLRVLQYLEGTLALSPEQKVGWITHWVTLGFDALEAQLSSSFHTGLCCYGDSPTFADCCLVPQIFNARRFNVSMDSYPTLTAINAHLLSLPPFINAAPQNQPDTE